MCKHAIAQTGLALAFAILLSCLLPTTAVAVSYNADVIIVGAGGAGMAAAYEAAKKGASVIVAELDSTYGGTAALSGGGCFAVATPLQKKKGIEDSPDLAFQDWIRWGQGEADEQWARYYIDHSLHDLYEWLETLGVVWEDVNFNEGNTVPRWHRPQGFGKLLAVRLLRRSTGSRGCEVALRRTHRKNPAKRWTDHWSCGKRQHYR